MKKKTQEKICLIRYSKKIEGLLIALIVIGILLSNSVLNVQATNQIYVEDFNLYEYRADIYLKDDTVCNRIIQNMVTTTFPSQLVVDHLDSKPIFQNSVEAWKVAHYATAPPEIAEGGIDEKGYYTAIILSVFKANVNNEAYIYDVSKEVTSDANKILSNMKKWVETSDDMELDAIPKNQILATISIEEQSKIKAFLSKEFKDNHPVLSNSSTIASDLSAIFNAVDTVGEAVELMEAYIQMSQMSDNMKTVLLDMHRQCPDSNPALKAALYEAALSSENLSGAVNATILNTTEKEVEDVIGVLLNEGWKKIIEANPYAKAFMIGAEVGTWLGDTVSNTLFSTDKTIEQYEKMKCLGEFTSLLRGTVTRLGNTYLNNKSAQNADNYFASIEALFSTAYLSCDFAKDYADVLYKDTVLAWTSANNASYDEYVNAVVSIKGYYGNEEQSLINNYWAEMECDYPEIYSILMGTDDSDIVNVTGINFDYEEVVIGLDDPFIPGIKKPIVSPANATNQKISYTSSDTSILSVEAGTGWCNPSAVGTVQVTATSEDGGYTDVITVRVAERRNEAWSAIPILKVEASGVCGEDSRWVLYEDGTLVIDGTGYFSFGLCGKDLDGIKEKIKAVKISERITTIGNYAFYDCSSLTNITIPKEVTRIGDKAFYGCSSLESIEIPEGVTSIGDNAFNGCSSLESIEIPEGVTSIGSFAGCSSLESIEIPEGVTSIGSFAGCSSLKSIEIPEGVTSIGSFAECSSLKSIEIPEGVTSIDSFEGCSSLENIEIPEGVTSIGSFEGCGSLENIEIPEEVTSIGSFEGCSSLKKVEIPKGVTSIYSFKGCSSLENIEIPEEVTSIGSFEGCSSLKKVEIPKGVTSIYSFKGCSSLENIEIPEEVTSIGSFEGCSSLKNIEIPKGVSSIGSFRGCSSLENIEIRGGIKAINERAFFECNNLLSIKIGGGVETIGKGAFFQCNNLLES